MNKNTPPLFREILPQYFAVYSIAALIFFNSEAFTMSKEINLALFAAISTWFVDSLDNHFRDEGPTRNFICLLAGYLITIGFYHKSGGTMNEIAIAAFASVALLIVRICFRLFLIARRL